MTVANILTTVADWFSLETAFRDWKEIVSAGRQKVRFEWANVAFHLWSWTFTMIEAWAWGREANKLVDRSTSPWDDQGRRPSYADKRRVWRRALLREETLAVPRPGMTEEEIQDATERLLSLTT